MLSLRSRHADLLRRYPTTPATADRLVEATRKEIPPHRGAEETPVRLVTNGLWPLVASRNGSGPAAAEFGQGLPAIARPMDKEGGEGGRGGVVVVGGGGEGREGGGRGGWGGGGGIEGRERAGRGGRGGGERGRGGEGGWGGAEAVEAAEGSGGRAASLAAEIAETFHSVSVALNTADPEQYEEVRSPSKHRAFE